MHLQLWRLWLKSWESRFLEGRPCDLISRNTEFGDIKIHVPGIVLQFWCSAGVAPGLVCELPHDRPTEEAQEGTPKPSILGL